MPKAMQTITVSKLRTTKGEDGRTKIEGYAAVFNSDSVPMKLRDGRTFIERIEPGAFADELEGGQEIVATVLHDMRGVSLGRRSKGTLELSEDETGLRCVIYPGDTTAGRDAVVQIDRGDLDKMSFGFDDADAELTKRER
jgi:HK97 family phage prohead protease